MAAVPVLRPGWGAEARGGRGEEHGAAGHMPTLTTLEGQPSPEAKAEAEVQPRPSCLPTKAQHLWGQFSPGTPW